MYEITAPAFHDPKNYSRFHEVVQWYEEAMMMAKGAEMSWLAKLMVQQRQSVDTIRMNVLGYSRRLCDADLPLEERQELDDEIMMCMSQEQMALKLMIVIGTMGAVKQDS